MRSREDNAIFTNVPIEDIEFYKQSIDELQQENEQLKEINKEHQELNGKLREDNKRLQERIDKAIEYIVEYRNGWNNWFEFTIEDKIKLLEILKGDSNEN